MSRRVRSGRALSAIVVLVVLWLAPADRLYARSFEFSRVAIEAAVGPDGSLSIVEARTYRFDGSYSWASYRLPLRGTQRIRDIQIGDERGAYRLSRSQAPGTFVVEQQRETVEIRWYFQASSESRVFTIAYAVDDVVAVYPDVAELYWKFIGTGWDRPTEEVRVVVRLPAGIPAEQIRVWGHGPLHGNVQRIDGGAVFVVRRLPPSTMVEGRVLFPPAVVPGARLRYRQPALPRVLQEEGAWASQANRHRVLQRALLGALFLVPLLSIGGWLWLYLRYGREPPPAPPEGYYRELPGLYAPAALGVLWRFGSVQPADFTATVLDLIRRGYLDVETAVRQQFLFRDETYTLVRTAKSGGLPPSETGVLGILLGDQKEPGARVMISRRHGLPKDARLRMGQRFSEWGRLVAREAEAYTFFDPASMQMRWVALALGILVIVGGWWATVALGVANGPPGALGAGAATVLSGIVLAAGSGAVRRRSQRGADDLRKWQGFRRFLLDFSEMQRAELPALTLWEQYLVYAVPLGVAHRVIEQLRKIYPAEALRASPGLRMWASSSSDGGGDPLGSFAAFTTAFAAATSSASSGSGGGGGFSGGGGGGGGGSGGSAG